MTTDATVPSLVDEAPHDVPHDAPQTLSGNTAPPSELGRPENLADVPQLQHTFATLALGDIDQALPPEDTPSKIEDIRIAQEFVRALQNASLDDGSHSPEDLDNLRHPPEEVFNIDADPDLCFSIEIFLAIGNASQKTYHAFREATLRRFPNCGLLSYEQVKRRVAQISGIHPIIRDMCVNSCIAYTGPFRLLDKCPMCSEPRYNQIALQASAGQEKVPRQEFYTLPVGPQLQALWHSVEIADLMRYRTRCFESIVEELNKHPGLPMEAYDDVFHGAGLLDAWSDNLMGDHDVCLLFSIDGAQLYEMKASDCWIYIWIVLDLPPELRYKKTHVLPGGFIPGPHKPKNLDSFLFPGFHHLAGVQKEGLIVWDARIKAKFTTSLFAFGTADTPGMAMFDGMVGHTGGQGCRRYCPMKGRHKAGQGQYYPVCLKPDVYSVAGCDHPDVDLPLEDLMSSPATTTRYVCYQTISLLAEILKPRLTGTTTI